MSFEQSHLVWMPMLPVRVVGKFFKPTHHPPRGNRGIGGGSGQPRHTVHSSADLTLCVQKSWAAYLVLLCMFK